MAVRQFSYPERRSKIKFNTPFAKAVENFRRDALSHEDYDPANLAIFGFIMGRAVLEMLKAGERAFGEEGQRVLTQALVDLGYQVAAEMLEDVEIPQDLTPVEVASIWTTAINEGPYCSVEDATIDSEEEASFHIRWCPFQDIYKPLDCRVQRYMVEGMVKAAAEKTAKDLDLAFDYGIPSGYETCHFHLWQGKEGEGRKAWDEYTAVINAAGLRKAREEQK